MMTNVGPIDRVARLVIGALLIVAALFSGRAAFGPAVVKYGAVLVGLVLIATAALRSCPIYSLLGVNTCPK